MALTKISIPKKIFPCEKTVPFGCFFLWKGKFRQIILWKVTFWLGLFLLFLGDWCISWHQQAFFALYMCQKGFFRGVELVLSMYSRWNLLYFCRKVSCLWAHPKKSIHLGYIFYQERFLSKPFFYPFLYHWVF